MAIVNLPSASGAKTIEEVIDVVENMRKTVEFLLTNVDSDNITSVDSSKTDITQLKIDSLNLKDLVVTNAKIGLLAVTEANIALLAVTEAKIANLSVSTAKIQDAAITNAKIDRATIDKLVVTTADIGNLAVTTAKINDLAVTTAKIADASITNAKIDLASINKLVVQTANIADLSVTTAKIATAAVGTAQISDASITDAKIVTLSANKITAGTIDAANITVKNLVADNIVTGTITLASANLLENTMFKVDSAKWFLGTNVTRRTDVTYLGNYSLSTIQSGLAVDAWRGATSEKYPAKEGETFTASVYTYTDVLSGIDRGAVMEINFYDNLGNRLAGFKGTTVKPSVQGMWERFTLTDTAPAGAVTIGVIVYVIRNGRLWMARPMLQRGRLTGEWQPHTNELLAEKGITNMDLGDGSIDNRVIQAETITGNKIVADTITAREIAARTITANEIVVGTITAASGILAEASILTATIADLAVTNAKINTLDAVKITTGTLDAARIGASTITAEKIQIGDFTNYATANEFLANSGFNNAYGEVVIDTVAGVVKKGDLADAYLMFCNYTPSLFKTGDVLYYEFYAKLVGTGTDVASVSAWGYNANKGYLSITNSASITITTTEQLFTGTITLSHASWSNAAYFLVGIGAIAGTDIQFRQARVYRKTHGTLLVDGSITANQIAAGAITANKLSINLGGRNIIKNSAFRDGSTTGWDTTNSTFAIVNSTDFVYGKGLRAIRNAGATTYGMYSPKFNMSANTVYSVSYIIESMNNLGTILDYHYLRYYPGGVLTTVKALPTLDLTTFPNIHGLLTRWRVSYQISHTAELIDARIMIARRNNADLADQGFVISEFKIEEGEISTTYSPAPEEVDGKLVNLGTYIDSTGVYTGKISFNQGEGGTLKLGEPYGSGVLEVWSDVNSDGIPDMVGRIDTVGAYFPNLSVDSIRGDVENLWTKGNQTYYFDSTSGNDDNTGESWALAKKNMQNFIDSLPKNLNRAAITLNFRNDLYGGLLLLGFHSGDIIILGNLNGSSVRARTFGRILLNNIADGSFTFQSFDAHGDPTTNGTGVFSATHVNRFKAYDIDIYGNSKASHGFALANAKFEIGECEVYGVSDRGLSAVSMSHGYFYNCRGSAPIALYVNEASIVNGTGTRWSGTVSRQNNALVGAYNAVGSDWVNDVWTVNTGIAPPAPPTPSTEITLTLAATTGDNYSTSGYWTNDEVKQGNWGYGDRYGLWYADLNAVKTKTIVSATITVYRGSGGSSTGGNIQFRAHNYYSRATRPAGTPTMSAAYARGPIVPGQTVTYDITDLVSAQIAAGSYRAIGVYTTGSANYMALGTTPTITVRYK